MRGIAEVPQGSRPWLLGSSPRRELGRLQGVFALAEPGMIDLRLTFVKATNDARPSARILASGFAGSFDLDVPTRRSTRDDATEQKMARCTLRRA
jgi:hypothetical protein